jgi:Zn-dependent protease
MNARTLRIGTIRGIEIRAHFTFLLVLPLLAFSFARAFRAAAAMAQVPPEQLQGSPWTWGLAVALALFGSVLLHELAHSLYALRKGGQIRSITLLMFGGVSEMSELPPRPRDEAVMALLGPAVSLAIGGACLLAQRAIPRTAFNLRFGIFYLGSLNVLLGLFNLLPAYPMDGGRIVRALLAPRLGRVRATRLAAGVGQALAVLLAVWGFVSANLLLMVVAFFVFVGAGTEARSVVVQSMLGNLHVRDVMSGPPPTIPGEASVSEAARRMLNEKRLGLSVIEGARPTGLVTLERVRAVPVARRPFVPARDAAVATPALAPSDDATRALRLLGETRLPELPVTEEDRLVGTVTRDDLARALSLDQLKGPEESTRRLGWKTRDVPT